MSDTKSQWQGLSSVEAASRLKRDGLNEIQAKKNRNFFRIVWDVVKEPMFILLVSCGTLYVILGDVQEGIILLSFVLVIMTITFFQERRTEKALEKLRDLSSPKARVIRDGIETRTPGNEVVVGDLVIINEGDRIPADLCILQTYHLSVDESLLTGESFPVNKIIWNRTEAPLKPGSENSFCAYSGTLVVQGKAYAEVYAIGMNSELGKIGSSLGKIESGKTRLENEISRLVKIMGLVAIIACGSILLVYGLVRGAWLQGLLSGITLGMGLIPEEFPVILTVFMALGAWRIAQKNVLTKRSSAIEALGSITVLCSDKTGTITENKMKLTHLYASDKLIEPDLLDESLKGHSALPELFHELIEISVLSSQPDPFDPLEKAIRESATRFLDGTEHMHDWLTVHEYPLSSDLLAMSKVYQPDADGKYLIAAKGSPEAILDLCHVSSIEKQKYQKVIEELSSKGLRLLGVARSGMYVEKLPVIQHDFDFNFLGFIGFTDPVRKDVPPAVKECIDAGIRLVMITGDYPGTAVSIAQQAGIPGPYQVMTGDELSNIEDELLVQKISKVNVFARVVPEQKLRIVQALKKGGEVLAMTGDGVNDAPALKAADIGIAMGGRGTDVAREAAALVLTDDDFSSIIAALRMGRRIFDNLQKAVSYVVAVHLPIAGLAMIPVFFEGLPLILFPIHIVVMELIIDPVCSVVFEVEEEEPGIMKRLPRKIDQKMFTLPIFLIALVQGLIALGLCSAVYFLSIHYGVNDEKARALVFSSLMAINLSLVMVNRSRQHSIFYLIRHGNKTFYILSGVSFVLMLLVNYVPFLTRLFHLERLSISLLAICGGVALLSVLLFELLKLISRKKIA